MQCEAERQNFDILVFDTMFCESILRRGTISCGFKKWGTLFSAWTKDAWLIPINDSCHWTLLVVLPKEKVMIYFDSLHGNPNNIIMNGILIFIELKLNVTWNDWTLFMPNDIPSQVTVGLDGSTNVRGNCGFHICSWTYIIATGRMERKKYEL